jgi:hypothetical protein
MMKDIGWKIFCAGIVAYAGLLNVFPAYAQSSTLGSQEPAVASTLSQQGGSATGGEYAPVLDSEKRPITAGGFVKEGPVVFEDVSGKAGLTSWRHTMGTPEKNYILETTGSGGGLLDCDTEGWLER